MASADDSRQSGTLTLRRGSPGTGSFVPELPTISTWPAIHALLAPAIAQGEDTTVTELVDDLVSSRAQLWVRRDAGLPIAAAVTTLNEDGTLNCQLLGGSHMNTWVDDLIATVAEKAKPHGVRRFTMLGRVGFEKVLRKKGWRKRMVLMELEL